MPDDDDDDDGEEDDDHRWKSEAGSGSGLLEVCVVCRLNETRDIRLHTWLGRAGAGLRQSQSQPAATSPGTHGTLNFDPGQANCKLKLCSVEHGACSVERCALREIKKITQM